jgi:SAM-dependent methyltransferase
MISPDFDLLKQKMKASWTAGDFGQIGQYSVLEAEAFVKRLNVQPGMAVLDVACGTGNLSIPAAKAGARVTGLDLAPNLLEQARQRAIAENLQATFDEGDAEQLPYADGQFDLVMTMFGAMFAPRPERVAAELLRVCRSGGRIAMANWTREGFVGQSFILGNRHVPAPEGIPSPLLWGDEAVVRERLGAGATEITTQRRRIELGYPFPPAEVVQLFRKYFGPTVIAFSRLNPEQQAAYSRELEEFWTKNNKASDGHTRVLVEYLEVIATRA